MVQLLLHINLYVGRPLASNFEVVWPGTGCVLPKEADVVFPEVGVVKSKSGCGLFEPVYQTLTQSVRCKETNEVTAQHLGRLFP